MKEYLHAATLTKSPTEKLDLVILEDYDHFAELVAQDGIPLARDDAGDKRPRWVKLEIHVGWAALTAATLAVLLLDDLIKALTGLDLIPFF